MTTYLYTRISLEKQDSSNQDLQASQMGFKIDKVFSDTISGSTNPFERPSFKEMSEVLVEGDTVVVYEISRIGRNTISTLETVKYFADRNIKFRVITLDSIDLCSPTGRLLVTMLSALATMEKDMLISRVNAGLARTKAEGTILGGKAPALKEAHEIYFIGTQIDAGVSQKKIAEKLGIHVNTVGRLYIKYIKTGKELEYIAYHEKAVQQRNKG